jgi:multidrug transporter EmrE-like cation transporter
MNEIRILCYILLIVLFETLAMTCFKKSEELQVFFFGGVFFYTLVGFLLCKMFKLKGIGMTNALWSAVSVVATTVVGVFIFKETLHVHDYIAIAFIAAGVVILKFTE